MTHTVRESLLKCQLEFEFLKVENESDKNQAKMDIYAILKSWKSKLTWENFWGFQGEVQNFGDDSFEDGEENNPFEDDEEEEEEVIALFILEFIENICSFLRNENKIIIIN